MAVDDIALKHRLEQRLTLLGISVTDSQLRERTPHDAVLTTSAAGQHWPQSVPVILCRAGITSPDWRARGNLVATLPLCPQRLHLDLALDAALRFTAQQAFQWPAWQRATLAFPPLIGASAVMNGLREAMGALLNTNGPVLICGPLGSGKSLVAQCLHAASSRGDAPLTTINCATLPSDRLIARLFGDESTTKMWSARSERGALLLQNVDVLPLELQGRLLAAVQRGDLAVRLLATTRMRLEPAVAMGRFRDDLHRSFTGRLSVPPLCDRSDDLPALIAAFIDRAPAGLQVRFDPSAVTVLQQQPWPGNLIELGNFVTRMAILFPNLNVSADLLPPIAYVNYGHARTADQNPRQRSPGNAAVHPESVALPALGLDLRAFLGQRERELIRVALDAAPSVAQAARQLRLKRTTLVEKMTKHAIKPRLRH